MKNLSNYTKSCGKFCESCEPDLQGHVKFKKDADIWLEFNAQIMNWISSHERKPFSQHSASHKSHESKSKSKSIISSRVSSVKSSISSARIKEEQIKAELQAKAKVLKQKQPL